MLLENILYVTKISEVRQEIDVFEFSKPDFTFLLVVFFDFRLLIYSNTCIENHTSFKNSSFFFFSISYCYRDRYFIFSLCFLVFLFFNIYDYLTKRAHTSHAAKHALLFNFHPINK